ncbi:MAG: AAA family ATPase, partial [Acidobacteriota bacterium]
MLLKTKFFVPQLPPEHLGRDRLVTRWVHRLSRRVTVVTAPAGFGKSTAIAEFFRAASRPCAYLALDGGDAHGVRGWSHLGHALHQIYGDSITPLFGGPSPPPVRDALTLWLNRLSESAHSAVLALDDVHELHDPDVVSELAFWLNHLPPNLHVVLAGRRRLQLPYARWRGRGELHEVGPGDLALDAADTATYLRRRLDLELDERRCRQIHTLCEGWPAAIHLAAAALDGRRWGEDSNPSADPVAALVERLPADVDIADFLAEEVLDQLPAELRHSAIRLSLVDSFDRQTIAALLGEDGDATLAGLRDAGLPLVRLDGEGRSWRYHHLFRDFLRRRAAALDQQERTLLRRRAARHLEEVGRLDEAFRQSRDAGDLDHAVELLTQAAAAMVGRGESAAVVRSVEELGLGADGLPPDLLLELAKAFYIGNRTRDCRRILAILERRLQQGHLDRRQHAALLVQRGAVARSRDGRLRSAADDFRQAAELSRDAPAAVRRWIQLHRSLVQVYAFDLEGAEATLGSPELTPGQADSGPALVFGQRSNLAQIRLLQGRLRSAESVCDHIFESPELSRVPPGSPGLSLAHRVRGLVALERGQFPRAEAELKRALTTGRLSGFDEMAGFAALGLAELARARGDGRSLTEQLAALDDLAARGSLTPIHRGWLRALRLHAHLDSGDRRAAVALVRRHPPDKGPPTWLTEPWNLAWIRAQAAAGRPDLAAPILDRHLGAARPGRSTATVTALVLRAWLHRQTPTEARR